LIKKSNEDHSFPRAPKNKVISLKDKVSIKKQDSMVSIEEELELRNKELNLKEKKRENKNLTFLKSKIVTRSELCANTS